MADTAPKTAPKTALKTALERSQQPAPAAPSGRVGRTPPGGRDRSATVAVLVLVASLLVIGTAAALPYLSAQLTPALKAQVAQRLPDGMALDFAEAGVAVGVSGLAFRMNGVAFTGGTEDGSIRADASRIDVTLASGALLRREMKAERVVLRDVRLAVPVPVSMGEGEGEGVTSHVSAPDYDTVRDAVLAGLDALRRALPDLRADRVELVDLELRLGDRVMRGIGATLRRDRAAGTLDIRVTQGERLLTATVFGAGERVALRLETGEERFTIGRKNPQPVTVRAALDLDAETGPQGAAPGSGATLALAGTGPDGRPYAFDIVCALDGAACLADGSRLTYGGSALTLAGWLGWREREGPARFDVATSDAVLAEVDGAPALPVDLLTAAGSLLADEAGVRLDAVRLIDGGADVTLSGDIVARGVTPGLALDVAGSGLTPGHLTQLWPRFLAPSTRGWVIDHVRAGTLEDAAFGIRAWPDLFAELADGDPLPPGTLSGSARLNGIAFDYLTGLPPLAEADGALSIEDNRLLIEADTALALVEGGDALDVDAARFEVAAMRAKPPRAIMEARFGLTADALYTFGGPLGSVVAALPTGMSGAADAQGRVELVLSDDVRPEDVSYAVTAAITGGRVPAVVEGRPITDAVMTFEADTETFSLDGTARLLGEPIDLALSGARDDGVTAFEAVLTRTPDQLADLGVDLRAFVSGPVAITLTGEVPAEGVRQVAADLGAASLGVPGRGLVKPAGVAGRFEADVETEGDTIRLTGMRLRAGEAGFTGSLTQAGDRIEATLRNVSTLAGESASVDVQVGAEATRIVVNAGRLDARPLLAAFGDETGEGADDGRLTVVGRAAELVGHNGVRLKDASFSLAFDDGTALSGRFRARGAGGVSIAADLGPENGRRILRASTPNGGEALRFLDVYERVAGGELGVDAALPTSGGAIGSLSIWDFEVRDEGSFDKVRRARGRGAADADTTRMAFDRLRVPFSYAGGRLKVGEGYLRGPAAGASFTGQLDLSRETMNLTGTFVPLYAINNVFSRVPLLGDLLGGRRREGLWGITFALDGAIADPSLRINPLSAIAPGIFRRIFEFAPAG